MNYNNIEVKTGVISGKFRLLHKAHKELFIQATGMCEEVNVIVVNDVADKRYSTITELKQAIAAIFHSINFSNFKIHIVNDQLINEAWDKKVLELVPHIDYIFNSKEDYTNTLVKNKYIETKTPHTISVSFIEKDILNNFHLIAREFRPYMNKKIVVTGTESAGKTVLCKKLAEYFDTKHSEEYGRYHASLYLGGLDECFKPSDFVHIVMEQTLQDKKQNLKSKKCLIVDTDAIVTMNFLEFYKKDIMLDYDEKEYKQAYNLLDNLIRNYANKVDLVLYLEPKTKYVQDGTRLFTKDEQRVAMNTNLKRLYNKYGINYISIDSITYNDRFKDAVSIIETYLNNDMTFRM